MNYKVKGVITTIGERKELENGATVLDYVVEETAENGHKTLFSFNMYKTSEFASHVDNFIQYNKVGDNVEVEFTVRGREYQGRIYNSLSHWKIDKVDSVNNGDDLPY